MSITSKMDKLWQTYTIAHKWKWQSLTTGNSSDESHNVKKKKPGTRAFDFIYVKYKNTQN